MAAEKVQVFTDGNFEERVLAPRPVLVDFWADSWPCKRIAPTIDQLAADFDGRADVGKLDVDDNPRTPAPCRARHSDADHLQGRPSSIRSSAPRSRDRCPRSSRSICERRYAAGVIIRSGPAGVTAALFAARANHRS
jgi:thiol-disulfide isomerase/thioredoxin